MTIRDDIQRRYAPYWTLAEVPNPGPDPVGPTIALPETFVCGACGDDATQPIAEEHVGSAAGGESAYEIRCRACGTVTEYRHAWG